MIETDIRVGSLGMGYWEMDCVIQSSRQWWPFKSSQNGPRISPSQGTCKLGPKNCILHCENDMDVGGQRWNGCHLKISPEFHVLKLKN